MPLSRGLSIPLPAWKQLCLLVLMKNCVVRILLDLLDSFIQSVFGGFLLWQRLDRRNWFQRALTWDLLKWQDAGWCDLHVFLFLWVVLFLLYLSSFNASFCLDIFRNKLKVFSYLRMWASKSLSEALAETSCLLFFRVSGVSSIFNA